MTTTRDELARLAKLLGFKRLEAGLREPKRFPGLPRPPKPKTAQDVAREHPKYRFALQTASFVSGLLGFKRISESKVIKGGVLAAWEQNVSEHTVHIFIEYRTRQRGSIRNPTMLDFEFLVTINADY